jgi:hypothetical protein
MISEQFNRFAPNDLTLRAMHSDFRKMQRHAARHGVGWHLTFDQFVDLWRPHWRERHRFNLVLTRNAYVIDGQIAPWAMGNVRVDTRGHQVEDQAIHKAKCAGMMYHHKTKKQLRSIDDLR